MQHAPMPPAAGGRVYQLTDTTVSPTRPAGRTDDGLPREETIPALPSEKFVDLDGNICDVALRNGRAPSADAAADERYGALMRRDQITAGCLPLGECPYTAEYRRMTGAQTLLGDLPAGEKDCSGKPEGCEHLWDKVIKPRRAKARAKYESDEIKQRGITQEQAERLVRSMAQGFAAGGNQPADGAPGAGDARKNLRSGKGE